MAKEKPTTKLCKHCKTEIPYAAKVCPQCRKKQKMGLISKLIFAFIVICILGSILDPDDTNDSNQDASNNNNTAESSDTNNTVSDNSTDSDLITVGSTFTTGDLKITINNADTNFTDYKDDYEWYAPADGMKYIMVSFTFENIGKSGDKYVSIYDFNCYADNSNCEQAYLPDDDDFVSTNLSTGRNVSFVTYYTVPIDAESIELEYTENYWTGSKIIITIQ